MKLKNNNASFSNVAEMSLSNVIKNELKMFPDRESNPGRVGESHES